MSRMGTDGLGTQRFLTAEYAEYAEKTEGGQNHWGGKAGRNKDEQEGTETGGGSLTTGGQGFYRRPRRKRRKWDDVEVVPTIS